VGANEVPRIDVFNKIDRLSADERRRLAEGDPAAVLISAATGAGIDELLDTIAARLALDQQRVALEFDLTSATDRDLLGWLYRHGRVHSQVTKDDRAMLEAELPRRLLDRVDRVRTEVPLRGAARRA
jgi:GTP-binding protein HflX